MRTKIEIDGELLKQAMKCRRTKGKRATVEAALRLLIQEHLPATKDKQVSFVGFFRRSPLVGSGIKLTRSRD